MAGEAAASNSPELGWVVQKFGGTSVGKFPEKVTSLSLRVLLDLVTDLLVDCS